jgi:hypothetical protein
LAIGHQGTQELAFADQLVLANDLIDRLWSDFVRQGPCSVSK